MRQFLAFCLWAGICSFFAFFLASGNLFAAAFIACFLIGVLIVIAGPQLVAGFWLIGQPTIFVFPNQVLKALPFVTVERILLLVLLGLMTLKIVFDKSKKPYIHAVEKLIFFFLGYALVSLVVYTTSASVRQDIWFYMQYAIPMLMFIVSLRIEWSEKNLQILFLCLTIAGVLIAVSGILQVSFGINLLKVDYKTIVQGHTARAHGAFSNAHTYNATLLILIVVTLLQYSFSRDALHRFFYCLAMIIMMIGLVLGQSRGPWLGFALALLIIFFSDKSIRSLVVGGAVAAVVAGVVVLFQSIDLGSFMQRVTTTSTLEGRFATWATALNMVMSNPVFGLGFTADTYLINKREFITGLGNLQAQKAAYLSVPHNEYLHVLVLLGVSGLLLFLSILFSIVRKLFKIHACRENSLLRRKLGLYVGAVFLALMFNSFFSDTYLQDYFWMLAYFLAGLTVSMAPSCSFSSERRHVTKSIVKKVKQV